MERIPGIRGVFRLARQRRPASELEDEFRFHLDMRTNELVAQGWRLEDARAEARRQFGDLDDARHYCHHQDSLRERSTMRTEFFSDLGQDLRYAGRTLRRAPVFAAVVVLTLALGIGANTALFSVVRGILLRPLPFHDPDRLVMVPSVFKGRRMTSSPPNVADWRARNRSFTGIAAITSDAVVLTGRGDPERLSGYDVSPDYFGLLGVPPVVGRATFDAVESRFGGPPAAILVESLWRGRFGADPHITDSLITIDNRRFAVAGVVPDASAWPTGAVIWFPLNFDPAQMSHMRGAVYLNVVARLKSDVSLSAAARDMRAVAKRLEQQYPEDNTDVTAEVVPMKEWITGSLERPLLVLLGATGFVLLIACANVASLFLVRGVSRGPELAVRTALGAGQARLARQLVTESACLGLLGGAAGLGLARLATRILVRIAPPGLPRLTSVRIDGVVLLVTLGIALLTGVVFGLVPARQGATPNLARTLRERRSGAQRASGHRTRSALVMAEVALAVMLLAGAGLLIRSFGRLVSVDPGFRTDHTTSFALSLPAAKYSTPERQRIFTDALFDSLSSVPGMKHVGGVFGMPLTQSGFTFSFDITGRPPAAPGNDQVAEIRVASTDYFAAMGIGMVRGRAFTADDRAGGAAVLLISDAAVKQYFPHEDPIGKHVTTGWGARDHKLSGDIVGIVKDVKQRTLDASSRPQFYAPYDQWPVSNFHVVMNSVRDPSAVIADARRIVRALDPDLAVSQVRTLDQLVADSVAQPRFYMTLLATFAGVALVLSAIGIYGVIAYLVGQRSREIGIRIALGASRGSVVRLVINQGTTMVLTGAAIGLVGALGLTQFMRKLLFETAPTDPVTYVTIVSVLALVALAACWAPASRASRLDPSLAIRAE